MRLLNVLFMPHPVSNVNEVWGETVIEHCSRTHNLRIFDNGPAQPQFEGCEVIVDLGGNVTRENIELAAGAGVKFVQALTMGLDHVEVEAVLESGMILCNCPGYLSSVALAQNAMMFILMVTAKYRDSAADFQNRILYKSMGRELIGLTLGIVGLGASGVELARRAKSFGMRIAAVDVRQVDDAIRDELEPDFIGTPKKLDELICMSDVVSLHIPLNDQTRHIIDARRIGLMKPEAVVVNVARGDLIDEEALHEALLAGKLRGAGLDTFSEEPPDPSLPVYQLPNVVVTPHTAGNTDGTVRNRALFAAENLDRYAEGRELLGRILFRQ